MKKLVKWMGLSFFSFLFVITLAGLGYRLFFAEPYEPLGKMIDMDGYQLHILQAGEKSDKPTLVIEGGGGLTTEFYHWLSEELKDSMRVVRYDRIGINHSDEISSPRDPETVANRLHKLLQKAGESPPYVMMGHSTGGPQIRVFTELYTDEVKAMFFLDATHPDHVIRYNAPEQTSFKYKGYLASIEGQAILCDLGIFPLYDKLFGTPYFGEGLPEEMNQRIKGQFQTGKTFRAYKKETEYYYATLERSGKVEDFGALPIRAFHAVPPDSEWRKVYDAKVRERIKLYGKHKEYAELSSNGKSIEIPGNHVSIFSRKENAEIICKEVIDVVKELGY
ncbi:MAG: alpha/beta fold hydrolase [Bacteroidota bacterium]